MSLYLSRLCLNHFSGSALSLAANPYKIHKVLLNTLPCRQEPKPETENQPKTADVLFRVDPHHTGPFVIVQSPQAPNWEALSLPERTLRRPPESKSFDPQLLKNQRLGFRLLCQPTVRKSLPKTLGPKGKRKRGSRQAIRDDGKRIEWLKRKGKDHGFLLESVGLTIHRWTSTKPLQDEGGRRAETREKAEARAFNFRRGSGAVVDKTSRLGGIRFDGILIVTDEEKLTQAIRHGIGPGKAFGFGLLSLAPAD